MATLAAALRVNEYTDRPLGRAPARDSVSELPSSKCALILSDQQLSYEHLSCQLHSYVATAEQQGYCKLANGNGMSDSELNSVTASNRVLLWQRWCERGDWQVLVQRCSRLQGLANHARTYRSIEL